MIYLTGDVTIIVLETANLEELKKGRPAHSPDKKVLVAWCPDLPWLAGEMTKLFNGADQPDGAEIGVLIDRASKRPENPTPPS